MKAKSIKIGELGKVYAFAELALSVDGDVTVRKGKFCVDGKSILGLLALDLTTGAVVEYPEDAVTFENFISFYEV